MSENWHKERQKVATATDGLFILKNFNPQLSEKLSSYNTWGRTKYQLYMEKAITPEQYLEYQDLYKKCFPDKAKIMQEGKDRENEIAEFVKSDLGFELEANGENVIVKEEFKIGATPDFYVNNFDTASFNKAMSNCNENIVISVAEGMNNTDCIGKGIVECKLTGKFTQEKLEGYKFQVQQQLLCTGLKWAVIAVCEKEDRNVGSKIVKRYYHFIKANANIQQAIIDSVKNFWKWFEDVKNGIEPMPEIDCTNERDLILLTIIRNDIEKLAEEYIEAKIRIEEFESKEKVLKQKILQFIGKEQDVFEIKQSSGQTIFIKQKWTKDTFYTEEDKEKALSKAQENLEETKNIQVGDLKTKSRLFKLDVVID